MLDRRSLTIGLLAMMGVAGRAAGAELELEQLVQRAIDDQDKEATLGRKILPPTDPA